MHIEPLVKIDQIETGDLLLIDDGIGIAFAKAQRVKVSERDGTEVIFNLRKNKFFNVGMYLDGKSWAKDVRIVRRLATVNTKKGLKMECFYKNWPMHNIVAHPLMQVLNWLRMNDLATKIHDATLPSNVS